MATTERANFLQRWADLGRDLERSGAAWTNLGIDLADRHEEPQRHYHGIDHILAVLAVLEEISSGQSVQPIPALAAFFHDAIYDPTSAENEEQSAQLAEARLAAVALAPEDIASVARIIRATATHQTDGSIDCNTFLDADLSILGTSTTVYDGYTKAVRAEYSHMAEAAFAKGRVAILRRLLERPNLFLTERGAQKFDTRARENLAREIKILGAIDSAS